MNFKKSLANPFLLVGQGFIAGAILFFACADPLPTDAPARADAPAGTKSLKA